MKRSFQRLADLLRRRPRLKREVLSSVPRIKPSIGHNGWLLSWYESKSRRGAGRKTLKRARNRPIRSSFGSLSKTQRKKLTPRPVPRRHRKHPRKNLPRVKHSRKKQNQKMVDRPIIRLRKKSRTVKAKNESVIEKENAHAKRNHLKKRVCWKLCSWC